MFDYLETKQSKIVGIGFICIGILALFRGRIQLEKTNYFLSGIAARAFGILFVGSGILILLWF